MKRKWYRSNFIKGILIIAEHLALAAAALCGVLLICLYSQGIRLFDGSGDSYIESQGFAEEIQDKAFNIISAVDKKMMFAEKGISGKEVVDLQEILEESDLTYENTSGLAYRLEDLKDWAESSWELSAYGSGRSVIVCSKPNGEYEYYYYNDFAEQVKKGEIEFLADIGRGYEETNEEATERYTDLLKDGQAMNGMNSEGIMAAVDSQGKVLYTDVMNYAGDCLTEKYAPEGAENLLEVLNKNSRWNGRIDEAYTALESVLQQMGDVLGRVMRLEQFQEGNTNLTYLYVDEDAEKVYTNKEEYARYSRYDSVLKEMKKNGPYVIIRPKLIDCETNLDQMEKNQRLQQWQHIVQVESIHDHYVFAVNVDSKFPVADDMAAANENYDKYVRLTLPAMAGFCLAAVIFLIGLIWLTCIAGRKPQDEELHLCAFDRWFTEIAAGVVVCVWLVGVMVVVYPFARLETVYGLGFFVGTVGLFTCALFLIGYLSLVRRIKGQSLWKNSLLRWLIIAAKRLWSKSRNALEIFSYNTSSKIKMALILGSFLLFQFVINGIIFQGDAVFFIFLFAADGTAMVYFLRKADGRDRILDGLKRITGGELQYKIPLERLTGEQKTIAEYINRIGDGLDAAVENSMKNERMKTELITNVSHDIKTPLTSIINYIDLLKRENFEDPKVCGYLDILEAKAQRLKVLTEDVVEASKASTGNIVLEMTDLNFVEMVHQVIGEFKEKLEDKNLVLMVHFTDKPAVIHADGQRMWRVLENIFNNVAKYAMDGTRVYADINVMEKQVVFSLKNISAQPLNISADELTERFIRGDVSRNTEGSGLGLSIAKSLTELQGGQFRLYLDGDLFKVVITFTSVK